MGIMVLNSNPRQFYGVFIFEYSVFLCLLDGVPKIPPKVKQTKPKETLSV